MALTSLEQGFLIGIGFAISKMSENELKPLIDTLGQLKTQLGGMLTSPEFNEAFKTIQNGFNMAKPPEPVNTPPTDIPQES